MTSAACGAPASTRAEGAERGGEVELNQLIGSDYFERIGFEYRPADATTLFREPHRVTGALSRPLP